MIFQQEKANSLKITKSIKVSANNILLKNKNEQQVIIENFAKLLRSITIPIQILCESQEFVVSDWKTKIENEDYYNFLKKIINENKIVTKEFKIIIRDNDEDIVDNTLKIIKNNLKRCHLECKDRIEIINKDIFIPYMKSDYIKMGDYYCRSIYIKDWPHMCSYGWLSDIYNSDKNIDISMFIYPVNDKIESLNYLDKKLALNLSEMILEDETDIDSGAFDEKAISAVRMKDEIYKNQGKFCFMSYYITIKSKDLMQLNKDYKYIRTILKGLGIEIANTHLRQDDAFLSTRPYGIDYIDKKYNFTTESLKNFFPFISSNIIDKGGILIGENQLNSSLIFLDPFSYNSALMYVLGKVGAGKSYVIKLLILRLIFMGVEIDIWDQNGEYERLKQIINLPNLKIHRYQTIKEYKYQLDKYKRDMNKNIDILKPRFLIVDELWKYINSEDGDYFTYGLNSIALDGRKCYQGLCVISQQIEHLYKSDKAMSILRNASIKTLMHMEHSEAKLVQKDLNLTNEEVNYLISARHEGILFAGSRHIQFKAISNEKEHNVITTDPQERKKLKGVG
ncbi:MAG: VirB4 family type IV secretion system protein [bacterium]